MLTLKYNLCIIVYVVSEVTQTTQKWFKTETFKLWLLGQAVKTPPFHGGNRGSIPLGVTILFLGA